MAKLTLLQLVQNILSDLNSDNVNSITDTEEAQQVAEIVKTTYFDLIADKTIPEHFELDQLTALADTDLPNYMLIPTGVDRIKWVKYDKSTTASPAINYQEICYVEPEDFLNKVLTRDSTLSTIDTITDSSGVKLLIDNSKHPEYFTSFDDEYLVFDAYNSNEQTTLTAGRSLIYATKEPTWTTSNSFTPDLDSSLFPLLLAEAKSLAFINNTQASNPKIEQIARRHHSKKQGRAHRLSSANSKGWPDFGRR